MKFSMTIFLIFLSLNVFAETPTATIKYVGSIAINPCQESGVLADWYARFGIETEKIQGGYYGQINTAAGPFYFGIHPKKSNAPAKCSGGISVVYRVDNLDASVALAKAKGILPDSIETDQFGKFAHFHDPDGNEVTMWGE